MKDKIWICFIIFALVILNVSCNNKIESNNIGSAKSLRDDPENHSIYENPIDKYFLPLLDESNNMSAAEYRNLQEIYGTVWQLEYKNLVLRLLSKCEFEEDRKNIEQFDNCVKEYIDATMSVIKTEKMDSYSFSPGDSSRIGGTGTYGWMKYMEGKIYRDVCMFTIGVNDSDFSQYEFVNRDYSKLSMDSLYKELR